MPARSLFALLFLALLVWFNACSSGLGKNFPPATQSRANLRVGIDLGVIPIDPATEAAVAGVVIPAIGNVPARDVVLLGFTTAAPADNADGAGTPLSRDGTSDQNGASDVFLAAVVAQDIETRAFSQSLAGKFRHPRCTTCHSMQAATSQAFASSPLPHFGPAPGPTFPNNDPATCVPCHTELTAFPVEDWQAPAASFDMRNETVAQLADRATRVPIDEVEHFVTDPRVLWALDSGILPTAGGRNGIADDDHDGVLEPEDQDGVARTVPGGSRNFIQEIRDWNASGRVVTGAAAVKDVTLVSRASGTTNAANGASRRPKLLWVPNAAFDPDNAGATNPVGSVHVVFESDASDVAAGDGNAVTDVFRVIVQVRVEEDATGAPARGGINLVVQSLDHVLVSARDGLASAGNGASTQPSIGGATGDVVVFTSAATDLVTPFGNGNGSGTDIFVRRIATNWTQLVSHEIGNAGNGGNGTSTNPALDVTGVGVAFESTASNLIAADLNAVRDVFHARIDAASPFTKVRSSVTSTGAEATGGPSSAPSIHVADSGRILVAFQSDATNLAPGLVAATNVFLFDSTNGPGASTLLNQSVTPTASAIGNGNATGPVIGTDGTSVVFVSAADNIDVVSSSPDGNDAADVFLVEVPPLAAGNVLPFRVSLTATDGADGNGASGSAMLGSFVGSGSFRTGFLAYATAATNLGACDSTNLVVGFLDETSGVFAGFTATPSRGEAPLSVAFTDTSAGVPTAWQWDFDNDGTIDSTEQNPTRVFATPGVYSVRLVASKVRSGETLADEIVATNLIIAVEAPVADFTFAPASGVAPLLVQFTDTSTQSPTSWQWDFTNDGSVDSTLQNPAFNYAAPGTYDVRLVVTNEAGTDTEIKVAAVQAITPVNASFTSSVTSGAAPLSVTFTNTSTGATSYSWDFGDGSLPVTTTSPTHVFTIGGTPTVTLTATGPGGVDTATQVITVTTSASFTMQVGGLNRTSAYESETVTFTSTSTGSPTSFDWDFDFVSAPGTLTASGSPTSRSFPNTTTSTRVFVVRLSVNGPSGPASVQQNLTIVSDTETVTLTATTDNTIYSNLTGNSNGAGENMVAGNADTAGPRRAMVRFTVTSIPFGSTVSSALVTLTHTTPQGALQLTGPRVVSFHRATQPWTEGTSLGLSAGQGVAQAGSGATWLNRSGATPWGTAGGDFAAATGTITVNDAQGAYVSTNLEADVEAWRNGTTNNGWILVGEEGAGKRVKWFATRENVTPANRPSMTVIYTRPLP